MEKESNVFTISGLRCAYVHRGTGGKRVVLCIDRLEIPRGQITMVLGISGSGKSTLVETLGLMNNTVEEGSVWFHTDTGSTELTRELWTRPAKLSDLRRQHFAFIFQNDYLMPYYTVTENLLMGRMIGAPVDFGPERQEELELLCERTGLHYPEIAAKYPSELSAGQKQRISFLRAVLKDYRVLLGDEATGNLDEGSTRMVTGVLAESLKHHPERSALLVSHNVSLAPEVAGCIVVITRRNRDLFEVLPANVFRRDQGQWWSDAGRLFDRNELAGHIRAVMTEGNVTTSGEADA